MSGPSWLTQGARLPEYEQTFGEIALEFDRVAARSGAAVHDSFFGGAARHWMGSDAPCDADGRRLSYSLAGRYRALRYWRPVAPSTGHMVWLGAGGCCCSQFQRWRALHEIAGARESL